MASPNHRSKIREEEGSMVPPLHPQTPKERKRKVVGASTPTREEDHCVNGVLKHSNGNYANPEPFMKKASKRGRSLWPLPKEAHPMNDKEGGGVLLLHWGHRKRLRCVRNDHSDDTTSMRPEDHSSTSPLPTQSCPSTRRNGALPSATINGGPVNDYKHHNVTKANNTTLILPKERSRAGSCSLASSASVAPNYVSNGVEGLHRSAPLVEKINLELFEWPRILVSLSHKEKEEDFIIMKGTKLPQRPKRRPKQIEKALCYSSPGHWLSDLTRGRYDVREKKSLKKGPRGLKAMESNHTDSD